MPYADTNDRLNRVLAILQRSFPQYMRYARPYIPAGRENIMHTIDEIATGQDALAERVSDAILAANGRPDLGDFPIEFTDTHDLSIDFLVQEALDCQRQDIADLQQCVESLRVAPAAQSLASEALGLAKGHLALLEELKNTASQPKKSPDGGPITTNNAPQSQQVAGTAPR